MPEANRPHSRRLFPHKPGEVLGLELTPLGPLPTKAPLQETASHTSLPSTRLSRQAADTVLMPIIGGKELVRWPLRSRSRFGVSDVLLAAQKRHQLTERRLAAKPALGRRSGTATPRQMSSKKLINVERAQTPQGNLLLAEPLSKMFGDQHMVTNPRRRVSALLQFHREGVQNYGKVVGRHPAANKFLFEQLPDHSVPRKRPAFSGRRRDSSCP